jgi:2-oxoisovalerate dehydrogenase E1 component
MKTTKTKKKLQDQTLLEAYQNMLLSRTIEERMLLELRKGNVSKWFSGIGQEAISTAIAMTMFDEEYILPMHRNLAVFSTRMKSDLNPLFLQWMGNPSSFTKGRDRSFHFGSQRHKIVGMISHLGVQLGIANGIALAEKIKNTNRAVAVFTGEGGTSQGDFHEALNVASVWNLPVLFCIENNGYGLSTPVKEQFNIEDLSERGKAYGMKSYSLDGNDLELLLIKLDEIKSYVVKEQKPVLIEFKTFRVRGHEEASGTAYIPKELIEKWKKKDPLDRLKTKLIKDKIIPKAKLEEIEKNLVESVKQAWYKSLENNKLRTFKSSEENDVFKSPDIETTTLSSESNQEEIRFVDAISKALRHAFRTNEDLVIMGQDIADYGGVFKITDGFLKEFGAERVRNTPLCESSIIETAYGLGIQGVPSIVELQFGDFISSGFNPVVNLLAKSYYRWGQNAPVVLRIPCGGGVGAGPFHSQSNESWFTTTPGLKVVYPSNPNDAYQLLLSAIKDPNPVLFYEHKKLYRSSKGLVEYTDKNIALDKANWLKQGKDLNIITYGIGVQWAERAIEDFQNESIGILDLRTLIPYDKKAVAEAVRNAGKIILLSEDSKQGNYMSEIMSYIMEHHFEDLDAPVFNIGSLNTPVPFAEELETAYLANFDLKLKIEELLAY